MTLDIERLRRALDWAEAESLKPDGSWDQRVWAEGSLTDTVVEGYSDVSGGNSYFKVYCGTSFCLAGNICAEEGDTFVVPSWYPGLSVSHDEPVPVNAVVTSEGGYRSISRRARGLLGITDFEAGELFDEDNATITELRAAAARIASNYGQEL